ncbi:MAG: FtsW/RodA/SpoVE family cell cycle protein [Bacteroidales bacterium]|nr:FtsW/RodA/SpoVE family cell cycle protein [Bacteroidales bacterium]MCL2738512.1 FtsW/RodA/SpoVE family cell cycle protein [Bacteroidales bacterium]
MSTEQEVITTQGLGKTIAGDRGIWIIVLLLALISLAAVYSSSIVLVGKRTVFFFLIRQSLFVMAGLAVVYFCHHIPLGIYRNLAFIGLILSIGLLIATIFWGTTHNDGTRWIEIAGISFQPAEAAKVALILYMAKALEDRVFLTFKEFTLYLLLPVGLICLLLLWGSNSAGIIMGGTAFMIMVMAGISAKHLLKTIGIASMALLFVIALAMSPLGLFPRVETGINRVFNFVNEDKGDSYQSDQAKIAIASAGFLGKGPGNSTQRHFLPKPESDFIYAIIVEEYGLLGGVSVVMLFLWFFYRACLIAKRCTRRFSALLVIGLSMFIVFQALLHIGVNVGILPVTGQTLPLVSRGGTSFLAVSVAVGMILTISRTIEKNKPITEEQIHE